MTVESAPPLELQEAIASPPAVQQDGTVLMQLIRPCVGRGKGRHLYEADMLKRDAHVFSGWKMYVDHDTDAERKARGGLPRSVKDLGGIVTESYWDDTVPAEGRFGQGAVMGKVRAIPAVAELVKLHPSLVESSINARATGVRPVTKDGQKAWLVEGIENKGTVDWVTEGGAGGKVVSLLEAAVPDTLEEQEAAVFDSLTDEELHARLAVERPGVLVIEGAMPPQFVANAKKKKDAAGDGDAEDKADGGADEAYENLVKKYLKAGMNPAMAAKAAKKACDAKKVKEAAEDESLDTTSQGGDVTKITAEEIREALVTDPEVAQVFNDLMEARLASFKTEIGTAARAQAYADTDRLIEVRDLRDLAHEKIAEARLPEAFADNARARFSLVEGAPTPELDVFETYDDEGNVTETAEAALLKAVEAAIDEQRTLVASLKPTRVRGQGPGSAPAGDGEASKTTTDRVGPLTRAMLQEAGLDADKVYATVGD